MTIIATTIYCCASLIACDDESAHEAGQAVGIYAVVQGASEDFTSNEVEVDLVAQLDQVTPPLMSAPRAKMTSTAQRSILPEESLHAVIAREVEALRIPKSATHYAAATCDRQPSKIRTHKGNLCWVTETKTVSSYALFHSLNRMLFFSPDGVYHAMVEASGLNTDISPSVGISLGTGCVASPTGDYIDVQYLGELLGIGFSMSFYFYDLGFSSFYIENKGLQRGFQYNSGISFSPISFLPSFWLGMSKDLKSQFVVAPTLISDDCSAPKIGAGDVFAASDNNAFVSIANHLDAIVQEPAGSYGAVMRSQTASSATQNISPLLNTQSGQGKQSQVFFDRTGSQLCADCEEDSIDSFLHNLSDDFKTGAEAEGKEFRDTMSRRFRQYQSSSPGMVPYALAQHAGANTLQWAYLAHEELAANLRGDSDRYLSSDIVDIEAKVGQSTTVQISASEIVALLGMKIRPDALEGATIVLDASPQIAETTFVMNGGQLRVEITPSTTTPILLRSTVDLSTAVGPFPESAQDWVIRPSLRRITTLPGPPAFVGLQTSVRARHGTAQNLTAVVTDENYAPVRQKDISVRFMDGRNKVLGEATVQNGIASLQTKLGVSTPLVEMVKSTRVQVGSDQIVDGFEIIGSGWSENATIFLDGIPFDDLDIAVSIQNSRSILFVLEESTPSGIHRILVQNPAGQSSTETDFVVE